MDIDVDPDWWQTLFDEIYLITDSRSINDDEITRQEIALFSSLIPIQSDDCILDLCGGHGRHALELCRRGCRDCTVLDYSQTLLDFGERNAKDKQYPIRFIQSSRNIAHPHLAETRFCYGLMPILDKAANRFAVGCGGMI